MPERERKIPRAVNRLSERRIQIAILSFLVSVSLCRIGLCQELKPMFQPPDTLGFRPVAITDRAQLDNHANEIVTICGPIYSEIKIPTILGIDVKAKRHDNGQYGYATGILIREEYTFAPGKAVSGQSKLGYSGEKVIKTTLYSLSKDLNRSHVYAQPIDNTLQNQPLQHFDFPKEIPLIESAEDLRHHVGRLVRLRGILTGSSVPRLLGVEVEDVRENKALDAVATGVLIRWEKSFTPSKNDRLFKEMGYDGTTPVVICGYRLYKSLDGKLAAAQNEQNKKQNEGVGSKKSDD